MNELSEENLAAWLRTEEELIIIRKKIDVIINETQDTPNKVQNKIIRQHRIERLKPIQKECISVHERRIALNAELWK